jgi:hypothetical protein
LYVGFNCKFLCSCWVAIGNEVIHH